MTYAERFLKMFDELNGTPLEKILEKNVELALTLLLLLAKTDWARNTSLDYKPVGEKTSTTSPQGTVALYIKDDYKPTGEENTYHISGLPTAPPEGKVTLDTPT